MKYLLLPVIRTFYVIWALLMAPIVYFFEGLKALWHWDKQPLIDVWNAYTKDFWIVDRFTLKHQDDRYYVYCTPWDFIRGKKTLRIIGKEGHKVIL